MFKSIAAAAVLAVGFTTVPAAAVVVYDAFDSFTGMQGAGGFTYGSYAAAGDVFTPFSATANCELYLGGTICINDGSLPGAFKTNSGAHTYGTAIIPDDRLVVHPGSGDNAVYVEFTAPTAGTYFAFSEFSSQDTGSTGVDVLFFLRTAGTLQYTLYVDSILGPGDAFSDFDFGPLAAGDSVGYIIDKGDAYFNDTTGVNFTLFSFAPEPGSWALLIAGFGLTGAALRRRRSAALTA